MKHFIKNFRLQESKVVGNVKCLLSRLFNTEFLQYSLLRKLADLDEIYYA